MFSSKIMTITIICIALLLVVLAVYFYFNKTQQNENEMRFTGVITSADFQGKIDGDDYITVNGKEIKLAGGKSERDSVWGKRTGINLGSSGSEYIGKTARVYARCTGTDSCTIKGNGDYFVEVVN